MKVSRVDGCDGPFGSSSGGYGVSGRPGARSQICAGRWWRAVPSSSAWHDVPWLLAGQNRVAVRLPRDDVRAPVPFVGCDAPRQRCVCCDGWRNDARCGGSDGRTTAHGACVGGGRWVGGNSGMNHRGACGHGRCVLRSREPSGAGFPRVWRDFQRCPRGAWNNDARCDTDRASVCTGVYGAPHCGGRALGGMLAGIQHAVARLRGGRAPERFCGESIALSPQASASKRTLTRFGAWADASEGGQPMVVHHSHLRSPLHHPHRRSRRQG
jgi:hypothetical protein